MEGMTMEWVILLLFGIGILLLLGVIRFFLFARECRKLARQMQRYLRYILEDDEDFGGQQKADAPVLNRAMGQAAYNIEERPVAAMTKKEQEALLQEVLGGFLS